MNRVSTPGVPLQIWQTGDCLLRDETPIMLVRLGSGEHSYLLLETGEIETSILCGSPAAVVGKLQKDGHLLDKVYNLEIISGVRD